MVAAVGGALGDGDGGAAALARHPCRMEASMMNRMRLLCRFRWRLLLGMGTAVLAGLLWPIRPVVAGTCHGVLGIPDMGACIDAQVYAFWKGMAMGAWNNDRQLLMATYQLDR